MTETPELLPEGDPQILAKLLRAIAGGTDAQASKHDIIFLNAADWLECWTSPARPDGEAVAWREALERAQKYLLNNRTLEAAREIQFVQRALAPSGEKK